MILSPSERVSIKSSLLNILYYMSLFLGLTQSHFLFAISPTFFASRKQFVIVIEVVKLSISA